MKIEARQFGQVDVEHGAYRIGDAGQVLRGNRHMELERGCALDRFASHQLVLVRQVSARRQLQDPVVFFERIGAIEHRRRDQALATRCQVDRSDTEEIGARVDRVIERANREIERLGQPLAQARAQGHPLVHAQLFQFADASEAIGSRIVEQQF